MSKSISIIDRPLTSGILEVSLSIYGYLFSSIVQYSILRVKSGEDLENRLLLEEEYYKLQTAGNNNNATATTATTTNDSENANESDNSNNIITTRAAANSIIENNNITSNNSNNDMNNSRSSITNKNLTINMSQVKKGSLIVTASLDSFANIFLNYAPLFKLYCQYAQNYAAAMLKMDECLEDPKFAEFIEKCESDVRCQNQKFSSFFIQPIQRIPRYILLLNELGKHCEYNPDTKVDEPALIKEAVHALDNAAFVVNEAIRGI